MNLLLPVKLLIVSVIVQLFAVGCNQGGGSSPQINAEKDSMVDLSATDLSEKAQEPAGETMERKIIRTGRISFETEDVNKTRAWVLSLVKKYQANVSTERQDNYGQRNGQNLTVRVPAEQFNELINEITAGVAKLESKEISSQDVTEEFIDVEARLLNKRKLEARFQEILKQAGNVTEIVQIEKQLTEVRGEIESIEGRLKYLRNQTAYSTLDIYFFQDSPRNLNLSTRFTRGFRNGWDNLILFFVGLVNLWPFVLIGSALIWYFIRRKRRKITD